MESTIEFQSLSPNLIVGDVNRSIEFYEARLGFTKLASVPETGRYDWAMAGRGPVIVMFQTAASMRHDLPALNFTSPGTTVTFYIKVKGLNDLLQSIKGKAEIVVPLRTTFYGANEFAIKDPDGYVLMFAEDA